MKLKYIILSLVIALSFSACSTSDGDAIGADGNTTTDTNTTIDDTNNTITIDTNGSLTVNFAGTVSSRELTVNNELVTIEVLVFGPDNAPYTGGTVSIAYPEKATTGVSVGSFSSLTADVINGKATFNYTGPKDLQSLVENNDTSTVFGFYHSSTPTSVKNFTFTYNPLADQIILETYSVSSSLSDGNITIGLESSKHVAFYVENDTGDRIADGDVNFITVEVLNEALVDLKDTLGNSGDLLRFEKDNDVSMSVESNTISGIVPIKITASFVDANDANQTISDVFNVLVLSGPATAMSISYAGTSNDDVNAKFKEKMIIAITDEYGNKVNTNPGLAVEVMSGYASDSAGPLNYMYHKSIATLDDTKFRVTEGTIAKIEMSSSGSNYLVAPIVSYAGGDGTFQGTAVLSRLGSITDVTIVDAGSGFIKEPTVTASGLGSGFIGKVNLLTTGSFSEIILDDPGQGYDTVPTISATGGGTGFVAEAVLESTGSIKTITTNAQGSGYAVGDELSVLGDGSGAVVKVGAIGGTGNITELIFFGGNGYSDAMIEATGVGNGDARFSIALGYKIAEIKLLEGGNGDYATNGISVTGGNPDKNAVVSGVLSYGVDSVTVVSGGSGYYSPDIIFSDTEDMPHAVATIKYGVNYVAVENAGTGYVDGSLTFTKVPGDLGSGASADVKIFNGFANVDEENYKLAVFGNGYVYNASGKWDFTHLNTLDDNELVMIDSYDGNRTTELGFAVGNNYRQDPCIFGKEWLAKVDTVENPIFDINGLAEVEISYDYYLAAKDIVMMVNLVGEQNSIGESVRLGEATKHTLRGKGIIAPIAEFPKGTSNAIYRFWITLDETVEPLRNANFTYTLKVTGKDVSAYVLDTSIIDECGRDTDGNILEGRAYVTVVVSAPTEAGTVELEDLFIVKEFK